jgi:hypothetical protein
MARYYRRDRNGKFASGGGGGSRSPARVRAGAVPTGRYSGRGRSLTGSKVYTRAETGRIGGQRAGARRYVSSRRGSTRDALVFKVGKNGRPTSSPPRDNMMTRGAVGKGTRTRPGSPIGGNKNVRYVSSVTAASRSVPGHIALGGRGRVVGRAHSASVTRRAARGGGGPRNGYVVMYGARAPGRGG